MRKRIFVILSRIPYPLEKGDKLRAFYQIRELSKHHDLVICALSDAPPHPDACKVLGSYAKSLYFFRLHKTGILLRLVRAIFSCIPFQVAYFYNRRIHKNIQSLIARNRPDHIYCQLIRTAEYVSNVDIDKTIDYQDVFSGGLKRRLNIAPWIMRPLLMAEYIRVRRYERKVFDRFHKRTIISSPDRDKIPHPQRNKIVVIPNGVDTDYFKPLPSEKVYDIVFTGNMAYPPNVNGAEYLIRKIMPLVWASLPDTKVVIAGATPAGRVKALASDRVVITGWVDDIREYYAKSKVFIAPMLIGTGLQNKVLEAMAMQLPCITSPLANKALNASEGDEILIGRNADEYAQHVLSLLNNTEFCKRLKYKGHRFVIQNFNWESTSLALEAVITE